MIDLKSLHARENDFLPYAIVCFCKGSYAFFLTSYLYTDRKPQSVEPAVVPKRNPDPVLSRCPSVIAYISSNLIPLTDVILCSLHPLNRYA